MTKHLIISAKIPLPDDEFEHAEVMLKARGLKTHLDSGIIQIFGDTAPFAAQHYIDNSEPEAPFIAPKPRKARTPKTDAFKAKGNTAKAPTAEHDSF